MNRLPTFEANVKAPIIKAIADGRDARTIDVIADEVEMFACPMCGHLTVDHSWTVKLGTQPCLINPCPCDGTWENFDYTEPALRYEVRMLIDPIISSPES